MYSALLKMMNRKADEIPMTTEEDEAYIQQMKALGSIGYLIDFEVFRPTLNENLAVIKLQYDPVLLFKMSIIMLLFRADYSKTEYLCIDSICCRDFLAVKNGEKTPDKKQLEIFHKRLKKRAVFQQLVDELFKLTDEKGIIFNKDGVEYKIPTIRGNK